MVTKNGDRKAFWAQTEFHTEKNIPLKKNKKSPNKPEFLLQISKDA